MKSHKSRARRGATSEWLRGLMYPEIRAARLAAQHAIRTGQLLRKPCEVCGATPAQAHHEDYFKPLEVHWLCPKDHAAKHRASNTADTPLGALIMKAFFAKEQANRGSGGVAK